MSEKEKTNTSETHEESIEGGQTFDREAEKEKRKRIRKMLEKAISESLKAEGFRKSGYSYWRRKVGEYWQLVYLQRSQWGHEYYIEAGICKESDVPEGEKPDIVFCAKRARIEHVIEDIEQDRLPSGQYNAEAVKEKKESIKEALEFEIPHEIVKGSDEYFFPSVSMEDAAKKIENARSVVGEYIPLWFNREHAI